MDKQWRNRDWFWTVGILLAVIILLISWFYNSKEIELNFSIISSAVSIALALIAIFIALKQDSDNQRINDRLVNLLNGIQSDVKNVDAKLGPKELNDVGEETVDVYSKEIVKQPTYTKEEVDKIINNVSNDITSSINAMLNKENNKERYDQVIIRNPGLKSGIEEVAIANIIKSNKGKDLQRLQKIIWEKTGVRYPISYIMKFRDESLNCETAK